MYTADFHVHSRFSPDGREPMEALAAAAAERGLDEICVTDHVDVAEGGRTAPLGWAERLAEYRAAACRWDGKVRLRLGVELGDMVLDFPAAEEILRQMPELDFVIGSLHAMSPAFGRRDLCFVDRDDLSRLDALLRDYLAELLRHARWGRFSVMGHLTLPARYLAAKFGREVSFHPYREEIAQIYRALIENGCGIECNTSRGKLFLPDRELLTLYRELGGEIVTLGSDAHRREDVGAGIREGQELLRSCGFRYVCTFEKMRPVFRAL